MPIQDTMMRGGTRLRSIISQYLAYSMPLAIDIMRNQNSELNENLLPYPKIYDSSDPIDADDYPCVGSYLLRDSTVDYIEILPSSAVEVETTYQVVVFVSVKTAFLGLDLANLPKYEEPHRYSALRMRDDLMAVLKNVIFNSPSLGTAGTASRAVVDLTTWDAEFPEPMKRGSDANPVWVCSGTVTLNINLVERTVVPYIGNANVINTEVNIHS